MRRAPAPPPRWLAAADLPWPWACLIALALSVQLAMIWIHIPWADELQATALARESHSLTDWYWNFRYEGHAPLWHLLLKVPLAFTDDPTALKIVQSLVISCSAALLHLRAPFSPGVKFLLSLNYFLFFEYGVIARDYSLTVLFFFGAIAFRRQPVAWLFIALLPQGGLQSVMLAGICGIIALLEQGWKWWGVLLAGCGAGVALVWMWPAADFESNNTLRLAQPWTSAFLRAAYMNGATFLPVDFDLELTGWEPSRLERLIVFAGMSGPILATHIIARRSHLLAWFLGLFIVANFILATTAYTIGSRHFGLWIVLIIGLVWTLEKQAPLRGATALLIVLAVSGAIAAAREITAPFSTTLQTAEALREAGGATKLIIPAGVLIGAEVHGTLRLPTYDIAGGCLQTFVRWRRPMFMYQSWMALDPRNAIDPFGRGLAELKAVAARAGGEVLLLLGDDIGAPMAKLNDPALTLLRFIGKNAMYDQWRYLYRLDVPPDPNPVPIPPCIR